jgi:hypothetical protein
VTGKPNAHAQSDYMKMNEQQTKQTNKCTATIDMNDVKMNNSRNKHNKMN